MIGIDNLETLFVVNAYIFQLVLITHFALRKWHFEFAMRFGRIVYALSVPAWVVSILLLRGDKSWTLWLGGIIYLIWAVYGFTVEYIRRLEWRNPVRWTIFGPYVIFCLVTVMFYWWPLASLDKRLWYGCAVLFIISTYLNITSHQRGKHILKESFT